LTVLMTDRQLIAAVELYFGGRDRAEHILTCDDCHDVEERPFAACGRCPRKERP
jgi:hypothetical protein